MKTKAVIENGFKETEIGLIPEDWQVKEFEECIDKERISRDIKIPQGKYNKVGKYPIVDQGASFVAGYTDDKSKLYSGCLPVIVFGDHTRIFKFVDFSFSLGADGTKLIQPKDFLNPKYFYYYLCSLTIESKGYNRHYKYLKEKIIAFPEKQEQQKISFILSEIQQAIEQQDKIIETTRELKKSLMNKFFTEGLHSEEQKETDIGLMPKSWDVRKINEFAKIKYGKQKPKIIGQIPVVGSSRIYAWCEKPLINFPTLIVGRKGNAGAVHLFLEPCWPSDTTFYLEWKSEMVTPKFLYYYMSVNQLSGEHAKTTIPSLQRQDLENYRFPFPNISEQLDIIKAIDKIDKKLSQAESKKQTFQALFRTMLNQLMTGKIRVRDLDVEVN